MIAGVSVEIGAEAVVVAASRPLRVLSSAVHHGGLVDARAVVNLHVAKDDPCLDPSAMIAAFARRQGLPEPWVGLLTAAATERAIVAEAASEGCSALAVVTVGLSNPVAAGHSAISRSGPSTINTIVVVDADPEPAALVNAVITVTEVKGLALREAGVVVPGGAGATTTASVDVPVAATGRGMRPNFGGPSSPLGWVAARAVRAALVPGIREWQTRHR